MSSYTNHMKEDEVLYRGVLEYESTPMEWVNDPTGAQTSYGTPVRIRVPTGSTETRTDIIGPYASITPVKSYVTRRRTPDNNLRVVRFERTTGWEEVV